MSFPKTAEQQQENRCIPARFLVERLFFRTAIDQVRAAEAKELVRQGYEPVLKKTRWLLLKRPQNLTAAQDLSLRQLLAYNLRTVRSYLLKEEFQLFWSWWRASTPRRK